MSERHFYPNLEETKIWVAKENETENVGYLEHPDCPYSQRTKDIIRGSGAGGNKNFDISEEQIGNIEDVSGGDITTEIIILRQQIQKWGREVMNSADNPAEKSSFFRLSVSLIEKLIDNLEKANNIKDYEQFQLEILNIMDKVLDTDQRNEVVDRLEKFVKRERKEDNDEQTTDPNI